MKTKQQEFLDILTNPRRVEVKHRLDELMQAYEHHLKIEDSFDIKLVDHSEYVFAIRITTDDKHVLNRTEDWFRHHFPAREYRTLCYAPPKPHGWNQRWRHYYCLTEL